MNSKFLIPVLVVVALVLVGVMATQTPLVSRSTSEGEQIAATVYKSPSCGCCEVYATYMTRQGYDIDVENIQDMSEIKQKLGVPYELESCHTMEVGGYVVEGHIPEEAIQKLLAERPDIKGIGMPGMPSGSPGMPGPQTEDFVIYEITHQGTRGEVFMTI